MHGTAQLHKHSTLHPLRTCAHPLPSYRLNRGAATTPPRTSSRSPHIYTPSSSSSLPSSPPREHLGRMHVGVESTGALFSALGGGGGGMRRSVNASRGGGGWASGDGDGEEGLGLLRQQLSAVQRIRMEHERKDATIAALRLEVRGNKKLQLIRSGSS